METCPIASEDPNVQVKTGVCAIFATDSAIVPALERQLPLSR